MEDLLRSFNIKPVETTNPPLEDGELTDDENDTKSNQADSKNKQIAKHKIKLERGKFDSTTTIESAVLNSKDLLLSFHTGTSLPPSDQTSTKLIEKPKTDNTQTNEHKQLIKGEFDKDELDKLTEEELEAKFKQHIEKVKSFIPSSSSQDSSSNQPCNPFNNQQFNQNQSANKPNKNQQFIQKQQSNQFCNPFAGISLSPIMPSNNESSSSTNSSSDNLTNTNNQIDNRQLNGQQNKKPFNHLNQFNQLNNPLNRNKLNKIGKKFSKLNKKINSANEFGDAKEEMIEMMKDMRDLIAVMNNKNQQKPKPNAIKKPNLNNKNKFNQNKMVNNNLIPVNLQKVHANQSRFQVASDNQLTTPNRFNQSKTINNFKNGKKRDLKDKKIKGKKKFRTIETETGSQNLVTINFHQSNQPDDQQLTSFNSCNPVFTTDSFKFHLKNSNLLSSPPKKLHKNDKFKKNNVRQAGPKKHKEVCKFYVQDYCEKGNNCTYLHKEFPCKFYHIHKSCTHSDKTCKFSHKPLTEEMSHLLNSYFRPTLKDIRNGIVLLGDATYNMRTSNDTWEWQQEMRQCEQETNNPELIELFRISDEFVLKSKPLTVQHSQNNSLQFSSDLYKPIKKEREIVDIDELIGLEDIKLIEEENRRNELLEAAKRTTKDIGGLDLKNSSNGLFHRRYNLLNKENNFVDNTSNLSNAALYKPSKNLDPCNLLGPSDFLNKLANETRIDKSTEDTIESTAEFDFSIFKNLDAKAEYSNAKSESEDEKSLNVVNKTRNLIDEIMSNEGYVGSLGLLNLPKTQATTQFSKQQLEEDLDSINQSFFESLSASIKVLNTQNVPSQSPNDDAVSNATIKQENALENESYVMSKSDDGFEFKLYKCDVSKSTSLEKYKNYYLFNDCGKFDPRLYKYFVDCSISTLNVKKEQDPDSSMSTDDILSSILMKSEDKSLDLGFSLSNLSDLRKKKSDESN